MKNLVDAKTYLRFAITPDIVRHAKRNDKNHCMIAEAVREISGVMGIEVGLEITRILNDKDEIVRYRTPKALKKAAIHFDKTGKWDLPAGYYILLPPSPSMSLKTIRQEERRRADHVRHGESKYAKPTGRNTPRQFHSRVIEFAKMREGKESDLKIKKGEAK